MTPKQAEKVRILRAKLDAGVKVKESEWPAWMRGPKSPTTWSSDDERNESTLRIQYLDAMGLKDPADANPCAIYWPAYRAMERGERCEVCARPGETLCPVCGPWVEARTKFKARRAA